jgi:hypothetical protein
MTVNFSALRAGRALLPTHFFFFWYSFHIEADYTTKPSVAKNIGQIEKKANHFTGCITSDLLSWSVVP